MRAHITNIYGLIGLGAEIQQAVAAIAKQKLHFNELGIYYYAAHGDTREMLRTRTDGILASLGFDDVVIIQFPTGNGFYFDEYMIDKIHNVWKSKIIILIHDISPKMWKSWQSDLKKHIDIYNRAEAVIVPTMRMAQFLQKNGLSVKRIIIRKMYDCVTPLELPCRPLFRKTMNLIGNPQEDPRLQFCRTWDQDEVQLTVTTDGGDWAERRNVRFLGRFQSKFELLSALGKSGGFGLLWTEDPDWMEHIKMNSSYELSIYLAAGLPVIIPAGLEEQDVIVRKKLGIVVESLDDAAEQIEHMSEAEYRDMAHNVEKFAFLLREGFFTQKALTDAVFQLLQGSYQEQEGISATAEKTVHVMDMQETFVYVRDRKISVARFGDGEVDLMTGHPIPYQDYDQELADRLREIITMPYNEKLLVCLPDVFERRERYTSACNSFWTGHLNRYQDFYKEILSGEKQYGSTFLSRPYIDLVDKSVSGKHFQNLKDLFADKDILIVEGVYSRSGVGNDLFQRAGSIERIICPSRNAYGKYEKILDAVRHHGRNKLILLMLGPTAKVLACDLAFEGYWAVDIGHIDSEYEWYQRGVTHKTKLNNKHTAEFNYDEHIDLQDDDAYAGEVVERLVD